MNNEKYNQIIDDAWDNYQRKVLDKFMSYTTIAGYAITNQEEFINKCKTDKEFSEEWGLKIEKRELTPKERIELAGGKIQEKYPALVEMSLKLCDEREIPTKLITITYKEIKMEIYE